MIELKHVTFGYNKKQMVLQINITIPDGENVGILGQSGCGTLASLVLGLFKPVKGEIYLSDNAVLTIFQHPLTSFNPDWTIRTSSSKRYIITEA